MGEHHTYYVSIVCDHVIINTNVHCDLSLEGELPEDIEDILLELASRKIFQEYGFNPYNWAIQTNYEYGGKN